MHVALCGLAGSAHQGARISRRHPAGPHKALKAVATWSSEETHPAVQQVLENRILRALEQPGGDLVTPVIDAVQEHVGAAAHVLDIDDVDAQAVVEPLGLEGIRGAWLVRRTHS